MKKGLLLSVVACGLIYAGGDIAPVEPVQPTAAPAACDFWGSIGFRYDFIDEDQDGKKLGDSENNDFKATVVLGVEKELGYGFGFGAELAGTFHTDGKFNKIGDSKEDAEISQLYLTYKAGNTAIKAGRQALPKAVSPFAWTDRTVGRADVTFNGITVVNTDIQDTTLVAGWIRSAAVGTENLKIGDSGIFALGAINKSIENTTLSFMAYYAKDNADAPILSNGIVSVWAAAQTKINNVDLGLQLAYAKEKEGNKDKTFGVAAYAGTTYNDFDVKLTLAYINDGEVSLRAAGALTSGFWGNVGYSTINGVLGSALGGDAVGEKQTIGKLDVGYKLPNDYGKIYAGAAYVKYDDEKYDKAIAARVGYSFNIKGVNAKIEYRYGKLTNADGSTAKRQRVRLEGIYKF